jgi:hypothetical protein
VLIAGSLLIQEAKTNPATLKATEPPYILPPYALYSKRVEEVLNVEDVIAANRERLDEIWGQG